jgi:hypothetical protein
LPLIANKLLQIAKAIKAYSLNHCQLTESNRPRMIKASLLSLFFLALAFSASTQALRVMGKVVDTTNNQSIVNATIILKGISDTSFLKIVQSNEEGRFFITDFEAGTYLFNVAFEGYDTLSRVLTINEPTRIGPVYLKKSANQLNEVEIKSTQVRVEQKGDTTQYNANAFKTHKDATSEDLVNKLPGITNEGGKLKANGEDVKKVLIDGKPFFGDDAAATLKNIPADMIDKVQVFDKMSDQAAFTGYDDGSGQKTINLITKNGGKGQFGKIYAGYGLDNKYQAGGNFNKFNGDQRFSILGMSNNINQQNFTSTDLLGVSAGGESSRRGGDGGSSSGFNVGTSKGIAQTHAFGINYSDEWSKKWKFSGSYFFNYSDLGNISSLERNFITTKDSNLVYSEDNTSNSTSGTHRLNSKFEFNPTIENSFTLNSKFSRQGSLSNSNLTGTNYIVSLLQSSLFNTNQYENAGYNLNNELSYRRKLKKTGRTISTTFTSDINDKNGNSRLNSINRFYSINDSTITDQQGEQITANQTYSGNLTYTEPIKKYSQLLISYSPSYNLNNTNKQTENYNTLSPDYFSLDTALTNIFNNTYLSHTAGLGFKFNKEKHSFNIGLDGQLATLSGETTFPNAGIITKQFRAVLPNMSYLLRFTRTRSLRIRYRASTSAPSISQLQEVIDNSNPLLLKSGNANLNQSYTHFFSGRFSTSNNEKSTSFFIVGSARLTFNYIGTQTIIPESDTTLLNGITLKRGTQLSKQTNLDGYRNVSSYFSYSFPIIKIKCNFSLSGGLTYNRIPAMINENLNLADNFNFNNTYSLTSNISTKLDFTVSYTANYSLVKNTLQTGSDNNYFYHTANFKINWNIWKGLIFNTNVGQTYYNGLGEGFNQNFTLLNAEIGYKILKDKQLELKISAFDLLNQNISISRTVTETYIEDYSALALNRYFLFVATYTLKKVGLMPVDQREQRMRH